MRHLVIFALAPLLLLAAQDDALLVPKIQFEEDSAETSLRSGVFPALVMYQSGGYTDANGDGLGEWGLFPEMAGARPVNGVTLTLLPPDFKAPRPVSRGYRFAIWLPASETTAVTSADDGSRPAADQQAAALQSRWYVAYAWPAERSSGKMFALEGAGKVYVSDYAGSEPAWHALFGEAKWSQQIAPAWKPYRRR